MPEPTTSSRSSLYAFFDGDGVGDVLRIFLLENQTRRASELSEKISATLSGIAGRLRGEEYVEVLIAGGDDLLIRFEADRYQLSLIEQVRTEFRRNTGISMSCGIGRSIPDAIRHLDLAKLYGKDQIRGLD